MKLVVVITSLDTGGAQMMLLNVLERLSRRFHPHVISLARSGEIASRIQALGIPVETLGMAPGLPDAMAFLRLVRRLKALKPEVVHTWMYHADLIGGLAARLAGVGAVGWCIRHSNLDRDKNKLMTLVVARLCACLSRVVPKRILTCSESGRQLHVGIGYAANKMVVVPNGFDLERFRPCESARAALRLELGVGVDTPLVGLIGRFDPQKNHAGFFEAAGIVHRRLCSARFVLAGKGIDAHNGNLVRAMQAHGVEHATHLLGLRRDTPQLLAALDVVVSSSHGEAFPNVVGEAMSCGVPCTVTDVGDSANIVADTGHIVLPGDMAGLAAAIESSLLLPAVERRALGDRARARIARQFEIGDVVRRYEAFYDELADLAQHNRGVA